MRFTSRRIEVYGFTGMLYRAHPQQARRMLDLGQAEFIDGRSIRLCGGLSSLPRAERNDDRPSQSSVVSTKKERMPSGAVLIQHKYIKEEHAPLYRLAITDCLHEVHG